MCPTIKAYTTEEQNKAADELDKLAPGSEVGRMVDDYLNLRDQVRACRGQK